VIPCDEFLGPSFLTRDFSWTLVLDCPNGGNRRLIPEEWYILPGFSGLTIVPPIHESLLSRSWKSMSPDKVWFLKMARKEKLVSALLQLVKEHKPFPESDPSYSKFTIHTHRIIERLKALGVDAKLNLYLKRGFCQCDGSQINNDNR